MKTIKQVRIIQEINSRIKETDFPTFSFGILQQKKQNWLAFEFVIIYIY